MRSRIGCERGRNRGQRRQFFPGDRKTCEVQSFDGFGLAHHRGDGFASKPGFNFGKDRLVGKTRNHTVTILSRDIFRGQNAVDSRMRGHESFKIAEMETCPRVGAADGANYQRSGGNLVGSKNLRAIHLTLTVEPDQPRAHRIARRGATVR